MKKLLFTLFAASLFVADSFAQLDAEYMKDQLIVKFKQGVNIDLARSDKPIHFGIAAFDQLNELNECKAADLLVKGGSALSSTLQNIFILTFQNEKNISSLIDQYLATGLFEYVQPNYIGHMDGGENINMTPNEPAANFKNQWGLYNDGSFNKANGKVAKKGADINILPAWDITTGDDKTIVAIIDGGLNLSHPEFNGRVWINTKEIAGNNIDDDNNGFVDDVNGWNFSANSNDLSDTHGHGTNVASIIGATGNNSIGWAGVNWKCKLMIVSNGGGSFSSSIIINAIKYAADNGARVINMSLGFTGVTSDQAMQDAINYAYNKNVLSVASMGNNNTNTPQTPACLKNVMAVGATNVDDSRCVPFGAGGTNAEGSNYGNYISVVAPGNWIVGCSNTLPDSYTVYNSFNGTSQSTPFVTGVASLILAINPSLPTDSIKRIIEKTASDQVGVATEDVKGWDTYMGWGRLNAYEAIKKAQLTTGIKKERAYSSTSILYPNPFNEKAYLSFDTTPGTQHTIILLDVLGKEVKRISSRENPVEISREGLTEGIYFYKTLSDDIKQTSGKLIVKD